VQPLLAALPAVFEEGVVFILAAALMGKADMAARGSPLTGADTWGAACAGGAARVVSKGR
jgi:hypothetical protein